MCALLVASAASTRAAANASYLDASPDASRAERVRPAGEVLVVLNEHFLNSVLDAITEQRETPSFPLSRGGGGGNNSKCASVVSLVREAEGVRTSIRFADGRINAPVAFRGSYEAPLLGCLNFEGWADAVFNLEFDIERQRLNARITVRDVKLKNVPSAVSVGITGLVQDAIDTRVNPVEILRAEQLSARLPLTPDNELRLRAREVRHEIVGRELRLRIIYDIVSKE